MDSPGAKNMKQKTKQKKRFIFVRDKKQSINNNGQSQRSFL